MIATIRLLQPAELIRGYAVQLQLELADDEGDGVTPSSWSSRLLRGGAVLATGTGVGACTWAVTADSAWPYGEDYRAEWTIVADGETRRFEHQVLVVHSRLYPTIGIPDLARRYPQLVGGRQPLVDETRARAVIAEAWAHVLARLRSKGRRPWLVLDASDLSHLHLERCLELLLMSATGAGSGGGYMMLVEVHRAEQERCWRDLVVVEAPADPTETGVTRRSARSTLWLGSAPASSAAAHLPLTRPGVRGRW
jgi:hypothetical protein